MATKTLRNARKGMGITRYPTTFRTINRLKQLRFAIRQKANTLTGEAKRTLLEFADLVRLSKCTPPYRGSRMLDLWIHMDWAIKYHLDDVLKELGFIVREREAVYLCYYFV